MASTGDDGDRVRCPLIWAHFTIVLSSVFVGLRFVSRWLMLRVCGWTDGAIVLSLLLSLGYTVVSIISIRRAYGLHAYDLTPEQLTDLYKAQYVAILLYGAAVNATKISILLLFLDVFNSTRLRRITKIVCAAVVVYFLWITGSNIGFCIPVQAFWDFTLPRDRCFSPVKWFIEMWLHIALDFVIFLLPIPVIRSMTLPRRQKHWLYFVFALGFAVCLVAIIRLYYMYRMVTSSDEIAESNMLFILCFLELSLSIAIPCLITLKPLVDRVFPKLLASRNNSNLNFDGSPRDITDSAPPPTISSAPTRRQTTDVDMQEV